MRGNFLVLILIAACGGGDETPDAPISMPACGGDPSLKQIRLKGNRYGMGTGGFMGEVCVEGTTRCVYPEMNGNMSPCVPATGEYQLRFRLVDWEPAVWLLGPDMIPLGSAIEAGSNDFVGPRYFAPLSVQYPPTTTAHLVFYVRFTDSTTTVPAGLAGATVEVGGKTTVYMTDDSRPDQQLAATTNSGLALITDVAPGMIDVKVTATYPNCRNPLGGGYVSPTAGQTFRIPAIAGADMAMFVDCTP
jgi:hypothetical protein